MKTTILLFLILVSTTSFGQTKKCDCSGPLSKDLISYSSETEYRKLKEWLYEYFKSDATTQTSMKNDKTVTWTSNAGAVIEAVPVKGKVDAAYSASEQNQIFSRLEQMFLKNNYLTDDQFNEIFTKTMGDNQLKAYLGCLKTCEILLGAGITSNVGGDFSDELSIQINFNSLPKGAKITLRGNGVYSNLEPIGELVFKNGIEINDGQSLIQYFKRLDPNKAASFSFNVNERIVVGSIDFPAKPNVNSELVPVGSIVASVLTYNAFLEANGFPLTNDMSKAIWIPCDGRKLTAGKYTNFGTIPDLRGLFLRGANDFGIAYDGVGAVDDKHKNPDNNKVGIFQPDAFKQHSHGIAIALGPFGSDHVNMPTAGQGDARTSGTINNRIIQNAEESSETRPKNISVYYYIKIN